MDEKEILDYCFNEEWLNHSGLWIYIKHLRGEIKDIKSKIDKEFTKTLDEINEKTEDKNPAL